MAVQLPPNRPRYVCVYVDDSNIFIEAKRLAEVRNGSPGARGRVRIDYDKLIGLCRADRPLMSASASGFVPPELRNLWSRLGIRVSTFTGGEQDVPDVLLQMAMYQDLARVRPPGIAVLVTGDGASSYEEYGFIPALEDMYAQGWGVEVLSWTHCLSRNLRWTQQHGVFIPLDEYYDSITFLESGREGEGPFRPSAPLDFTNRPKVN